MLKNLFRRLAPLTRSNALRWAATATALACIFAGTVLLRHAFWNDDSLLVSDAAFRYRLAEFYARGEAPPERDVMVMPPEGQAPREEFFLLEDALVGGSYRLLHPEFDAEGFRRHLAWMVCLLSSLAAGSVFLLGRAVWRRRDAALIAAFVAAFAVGCLDRTIGVYLREHLAVPCVLLGWAGMIGWLRSQPGEASRRWWFAAAGAGWGLALAAWHMAGFLLLVTALLLALWSLLRPGERAAGWLALLLGGITLLESLVVGPLASKGFAFSPAALLLYLTALVALTPDLRGLFERRKWARPTVLLGGWGLALLIANLAGGAHAAQFNHVYALLAAKLTHLGVKPADPGELSWIARALWNGPFADPPLYGFLYSNWLLLPLAGWGGWRLFRRRGELPAESFWLLLLTAGFLAAYLLVSRLQVLATPLLAVLAAGVWLELERRRWVGPVAAGVLAVSVLYQGVNLDRPNAVSRVFSELARPTPVWPTELGGELQRVFDWLGTNTPSDAVVACRYNLAPMVLAYADRSVALHSIWESPPVRDRSEQYSRALFGTEDDLYRLLDGWGVDYLLVTAAEYLDTGPESARYESDALTPREDEALAVLCLHPETSLHFRLVWQSTSFRIFTVGERPPGIPFVGGADDWMLAGAPAGEYPVEGEYSPFFDARSPVLADGPSTAARERLLTALTDYNSAAALFEAGRYREAAEDFGRVTAGVGNLLDAALHRAEALYKAQDYPTAAAALEESIADRPATLAETLLRAKIIAQRGQPLPALELLQSAATRLPREPSLLSAQAAIWRALGSEAAARELELRAEELRR